MSGTTDPLIITRRDIRRLMSPADYLDAVEVAFQAAAMGKASSPMPMHLPVTHGAFHGKGASISLGRDYVVVKVNGNFPGNPAKHGLPTIQGAILLFDAADGRLLAVMDSMSITALRTAAASAVAARHLARERCDALLICGCGGQAAAQLRAMLCVRKPGRVHAYDQDARKATRFAALLQ